MVDERKILDEYPDDGWLRGYFFVGIESTEQPVGHRTGRAWKNIDYLRLRDVALQLLDPRPGQRVLDLGCADGATMVYCGMQGATMSGVDLDADQVAFANTLMRRFSLAGEATRADAAAPIFPDNHFDGAIASDFFEHISAATKLDVLRNAYRSLKPGRPLVIKTPNLSYLKLSLLYRRASALMHLRNPAAVVIPNTPGTPDPQHIGLTMRRELSRLLIEAGFLNYRFVYAPLRRFGYSSALEILSTEIPILRDWLAEDLICITYKPISLAHFPD